MADIGHTGAVAIIHPPGYVGVNPTIQSAISLLSERGHDVHLISLTQAPEEGLAFTSHVLREEYPVFATRYGRLLARLWMPAYAWLTVRRVRAVAVIAVDSAGAVAASLTLLLTRVRFLYLSLHIESLADAIRSRRIGAVSMRLIERWVLGRMDAVITQDEHRQQQLQVENGLDDVHPKFFRVPNSHRGRARLRESTFYQEKLELPLDESLVLTAGAVHADWSHTEFLSACAARQDPPFYTLVIQTREPLQGSSLAKVRALCHSRAVLSPEPVAGPKLTMAFASATVGAAIYTNVFHRNQTFVGGASGKMMSYLAAGVPVIMRDSPGVTEVIREFDCGKVLSALDCDEFNDAVRAIQSDRARYSANAVRCYNARYEFDEAFSAVYEFMTRRYDRRSRR
jgi:hypothetical protein